MEKPFVLWSTKLQGWFTLGATYSTDLTKARRFNAFDASALCMKHYDPNDKVFGYIPVRHEDLLSVMPVAERGEHVWP